VNKSPIKVVKVKINNFSHWWGGIGKVPFWVIRGWGYFVADDRLYYFNKFECKFLTISGWLVDSSGVGSGIQQSVILTWSCTKSYDWTTSCWILIIFMQKLKENLEKNVLAFNENRAPGRLETKSSLDNLGSIHATFNIVFQCCVSRNGSTYLCDKSTRAQHREKSVVRPFDWQSAPSDGRVWPGRTDDGHRLRRGHRD